MIFVDKVFTCSNCGSHKVEEVMINVTLLSEVIAIEDNGDDAISVHYDYHNTEHYGGEVCHYQCKDCGKIIANNEFGLKKVLCSQKS
jgi:predicted nucleic-acid-binding Zn-ribbon protein